jgi:hypothetical protein
MFDDLNERMRRDETTETTKLERFIRNAIIAVLSVFLFGGLYFLVQTVE